MTHCTDCGEELAAVETRVIDTFSMELKDEDPEMGDPTLYECPHCGAVLGIGG